MSLPAGTTPRGPDEPFRAKASVHAVDVDHSSLCDLVAANGLVNIDSLVWDDIPGSMRCPACAELMAEHGLKHL